MRLVVANLLPLITSPSFFLWHLVGAIVCIPSFRYAFKEIDAGSGAFVAVLVIPAWMAYLLCSLQKDLLVKPFSFCLPRRPVTMRDTFFAVGILTCAVACLPVLESNLLHGAGTWIAFGSAFCFCFSLYWVLTGFLLRQDNVSVLLGPVLVAWIVLVEFPETRVKLEQFILFGEIWNLTLAVLLSGWLWRQLGTVNLARKAVGRRFFSLQMIWRKSASEEFGAESRRMALARRNWGFRGRILEYGYLRIGRHPFPSFRRRLAALEYVHLGYLLPFSPWSLPLLLAFVAAILVIAGFAPLNPDGSQVPASNAVFVLMCVMGMHLPVPLFSNMLLPVSRRQHFHLALSVACLSGLWVLGLSFLIYLFYQALFTWFPTVSLWGSVYTFRPSYFETIFVPFAYLPLTMILKIWIRQWLFIPEIALLLAAGLVIVKAGNALHEAGVLAIGCSALLCWSALASVLWSSCIQSDLVRE
ncbi:MAG: hypothetical protein DWQ01_00765 [Planctomycetota bacterium]|nr:MAG: hypothetical protein DWQ01_00765 [Planctomycetota bacterium]